MLKTLSLFMAWVVFVNSAHAAKMSGVGAATAAPASKTLTLQEQTAQIPAGSKVEVRLTDNEKLRGQLGAVSDQGIILNYAKAGQTEERKLAFIEMKSIKVSRGFRAIDGVILAVVGVGVVIGVFMAVYLGGSR